MDVDEDYSLDDAADEFGMHSLEEGGFVGSDDLVEYSAGEDDLEEDGNIIIKTEDCVEDTLPKSVINSSNLTVKRVTNSGKPMTLQRIAPKSSVNVIRTTNSAGKVVLIQRQPPSTVPVKLLNNARPAAMTTNTTSYHLVKNEGSVMMRPKVAASSTVRRMVAAAAPDSAAKKAPTHVVIQTKSSTAGTTTKTVTVAEAHQMGLLNNKVKQMVSVAKPKPVGPLTAKSPVKILPGSSTGNTPTTGTLVKLKQSPGASGQHHRVLIKANPASGATKTVGQHQKLLLPQSAIQAGQQTGQIQAINIPGKGIQYVRFLNQNSPSTSSRPVTGRKIVQVVNKPSAASITASATGSKVFVQNNKTYVLSNGNVATARAVNSSSMRAIPSSTTQTLVRKTIVSAEGNQIGYVKKEPDATHYVAVVRKEDGRSPETVTTLSASQLSQLQGTTISTGGAKTKIVMVPSDYAVRSVKNSSFGTTLHGSSNNNTPAIISVKRESMSGSEDENRKGPSIGTAYPDEAYKKRPCNCTKSQCLKLYCDCFANGEFCYNCNCRDCYNNLDNEEERQKAIRATLERNPSAFKPKVCAVSAAEDSLRQHTKGCNCKRSGCLKNYCECYEAKIPCSNNCKCIGCRNTEQFSKEFEYTTGLVSSAIAAGSEAGVAIGVDLEHLSGDDSMADGGGGQVEACLANISSSSVALATGGLGECSTASSGSGLKRSNPAEPDLTQFPPSKQPYNFMTPDVIEATVQCMIAQADECQKRGCNIRTAERMILEEFGRCLVEIIDFSTKSDS
ncbi:protein lin-54 homolog [Sabethes cyaneus]|uniref:protein lin-54 homolog n=1 Tax=Sabethes cyaneus TaxID=53552 RepID=UPI00237EA10C|nr:protein lin-54 homolog [Sabethes cyaneus]